MSIYKLPVYMVVMTVVVFIIIVIAYLYYSLFCYKLQAITAGLEDEKIKKEYRQSTGKLAKAADIISAIFTVLLFAFFAASVYTNRYGNYFPVKGMGTLQVVISGSMSYAAETNTYIAENSLDNQFDMYDIIGIKPVSQQENLKLYDVVVYEKNDKLIAHRIIDSMENDGKKYYILRGDANSVNDSLPVEYNEIIGVYTGFKIPALGIFVIFLQSALGYVAMGLVLIMEFIFPYFEKKIVKAIENRLKTIGYIE